VTRRPQHLDGVLSAVLLVAVPVGLGLAVGLPRLPSHPSTHSAAVEVLADLTWLIWLWCLLGVVLSTISRVRSRDLEIVSSARSIDRLGARVAAIVLSMMTLTAAPTSGAAPSTAPAAAQPASASPLSLSSPTLAVVEPSTYVVQAGDCLWTIAEHLYGDGEQWTTIAASNLGHLMDDGQLFVDPSLIMPGWHLVLPPPPSSQSPGPALVPPPSAPLAEVPVQTHRRAVSVASSTSGSVDRAVVVSPILGSGVVMLALLRRRRRRSGAVIMDEAPSEAEHLIDADVALARLAPIPAATLVERAVLLAAADEALSGSVILSVGGDGARLFADGHQTWRAAPVDLTIDPVVSEAPAVVIPLGDAEGVSWSLVIPRGADGVLGGAQAASVLGAALDLQEEFIWGHMVLGGSSNPHGDSDPALDERGSLRFVVGDRPAGPHDGRDVAVMRLLDDADVLIGDRCVTIRSLNVTFPAALLSPVAEELLADPEETAGDAPRLAEEPGAPREDGEPDSDLGASIGEVVVRLLTSEPRIDGLGADLEPKRARRAIELVAYLALHHPEAVTSDRLRSRVLGSSEADAAAKTLFNVASAARRSLGVDHEGAPRLPAGSRQGLYRISASVTTDVDQLAAYVTMAETAEGDEEALALLRAAVELIESEPMATVLAGYEWFDAEGHRGRLESLVESATCRMVALALEQGHTKLATTGLARAKMVVPFSESLAEAAIEVAAAHGDPDGLRRAFSEMARLVDEIDPGSWPSPAIERRYAELRRQLGEDPDPQASFAAMDAAPRSTSPSAPAAL